MNSLTFKNNTNIIWEHGLDGGGSTHYLDFLTVLLEKNKKYKNGLEWCAGLGAVGFSILDSGLCENMSFSDIYEPAGRYVLENATKNNLSDRVNFYHVDMISKLPTDLKLDLVVGNPPHCVRNEITNPCEHSVRLIVDENWNIHSEFFSSIKNYLNEDADIFLSETDIHQDHIDFAEANGLVYVGSYPGLELRKNSTGNAVIMHYRLK